MAKKRVKKKKNTLVTPENIMLTQPPKRKEEDKVALAMTNAEMKIKLEREFRRYVPRRGGQLRKGLEDNKAVIQRVKSLMKALGRSKMAWDPEIHVPGIDNPTVRDLTGVI